MTGDASNREPLGLLRLDLLRAMIGHRLTRVEYKTGRDFSADGTQGTSLTELADATFCFRDVEIARLVGKYERLTESPAFCRIVEELRVG